LGKKRKKNLSRWPKKDGPMKVRALHLVPRIPPAKGKGDPLRGGKRSPLAPHKLCHLLRVHEWKKEGAYFYREIEVRTREGKGQWTQTKGPNGTLHCKEGKHRLLQKKTLGGKKGFPKGGPRRRVGCERYLWHWDLDRAARGRKKKKSLLSPEKALEPST